MISCLPLCATLFLDQNWQPKAAAKINYPSHDPCMGSCTASQKALHHKIESTNCLCTHLQTDCQNKQIPVTMHANESSNEITLLFLMSFTAFGQQTIFSLFLAASFAPNSSPELCWLTRKMSSGEKEVLMSRLSVWQCWAINVFGARLRHPPPHQPSLPNSFMTFRFTIVASSVHVHMHDEGSAKKIRPVIPL